MGETPENQGLMSMTGFSPIQGSVNNLAWNGDIRSVNGRSLDLRLRLPDVDGLEPEVRKRLQSRLARGNVTVQIRLHREETSQSALVSQDGLAAALKVLGEVETAAKAAQLDIAPTTAADIAGMRGVIEVVDGIADSDADSLRKAILVSFEAALDAFLADRQREGAALHSVLVEQLGRVATLVAEAETAAGDREDAARAAMKRNLSRILDLSEMPDEARLAQELALLAVKSDVTEELDRLRAHIDAAHALLAKAEPVGRKFDFLMQEFNREANTLCSKAQSTTLTALGLDLKAVIDQMREQVQNIE